MVFVGHGLRHSCSFCADCGHVFVVDVDLCGDIFSVAAFGAAGLVVGIGTVDHPGLVGGPFGHLCVVAGGRV